MDIAPLNPKYKLKLGKAYGTTSGNRFKRVEVIDKETGKTVKRIDVKTRDGRRGSEETRAKIIKDFALMGLRNNQHSIDATIYENPNGRNMAKASGRKKTTVSRKKTRVTRGRKKTTARRATKKSVSRRVSKRVTKKVAAKRNPAPALYKLKVGSSYFTGTGLSRDSKNACCFTSLAQAKRVGNRLATATGKKVALHSNRSIKKK